MVYTLIFPTACFAVHHEDVSPLLGHYSSPPHPSSTNSQCAPAFSAFWNLKPARFPGRRTFLWKHFNTILRPFSFLLRALDNVYKDLAQVELVPHS
jgi:hypothetical protein